MAPEPGQMGRKSGKFPGGGALARTGRIRSYPGREGSGGERRSVKKKQQCVEVEK